MDMLGNFEIKTDVSVSQVRLPTITQIKGENVVYQPSYEVAKTTIVDRHSYNDTVVYESNDVNRNSSRAQ